LIARIPCCGADDATAAVEATLAAQPAWQATDVAVRAACLTRLAEVVEDRA
jgi:acyl-CoA reductase-like NAD-dependent aldehyde dehydrogenase